MGCKRFNDCSYDFNPDSGKTAVRLYAFINLIGPFQLAIQVESKNRTGRRQTKGITILNDVNINFRLATSPL